MMQDYQKVNKVFVTRIVSPGLHDTAMLMPGVEVVVDGFDPNTGEVRPAARGGWLISLVVPSPGAKAEGFVSGHGWFTIGRLWPEDGHREAVREAELAAGNPISDHARKMAEQAGRPTYAPGDTVPGPSEEMPEVPTERQWTPDGLPGMTRWSARDATEDTAAVDPAPDTWGAIGHDARAAAKAKAKAEWRAEHAIRLPFPLLSTVVMDAPPELAGRTDRDNYADGLVVGYEVRAGYALFARVEWWDACDLKEGSFEVSRLQRKDW